MILLLLLLSVQVFAVEGNLLKGGLGFISTPITLGDFSPVNSALRTRGFPEFRNLPCVGLAGGGYFQLRRNLVAGTRGGSICSFNSSGNDRYEVKVGGGYLLAGLGYLGSAGRNFLIAELGLGYGGIVADVRDKVSRMGDFHTHHIAKLNALFGGVSLITARWLKGGFFMGLQAEFLYPLSGMYMEGERIGGFYSIGIVVGGGYLRTSSGQHPR